MPPASLLRSLLAPHRRQLLWLAGLAVLGVIDGVAAPVLAGGAVDAIQAGDEDRIFLLAGAIALVAVFGAIVAVAAGRMATTVTVAVVTELRRRMFEHLLRLDQSFFDRQPTGQLVSRLTGELNGISQFLGLSFAYIGKAALTIIASAVVMFALEPALAAVALAPLAGTVACALRLPGRIRPALIAARQRVAEVAGLAAENIAGVRIVRAFARERAQRERFEALSERALGATLHVNRVQARYVALMTLFPALGLFAVMLYGGNLALDDNGISDGTWVTFFAFLLLLIPPAEALGTWLTSAQTAMATLDRAREILQEQPAIGDRPDPAALPDRTSVALHDVDFAYPGTAPTLRRVDLAVDEGRTLGIVGPTGSGKSTLIALVNRLYDAERGVVEVAGRDVKDVALHSLRRAVAVADRESFLVYGTIRDNIAYGRPEASDAEVEAAAAVAQLDRAVAALNAGYDTEVGEAGATLSGGQRQRVAIARALLVDPRVLVLDHATSNLDARTETALVSELRGSAPKRATIVVSDRPGTIATADEVVVLDGGVIAARGAHRELLADDERYRRLSMAADVDELGAAARASQAPRADGRPATKVAPPPPRSPRSRRPRDSASPERQIGTRRAFAGVAALLARQGARPYLALVAVIVGTLAALAPPFLAGRAVDDVLAHDSAASLDELCVALGLSVLLLGAATYAQTRLIGSVGQLMLRDLRERAFAHLQRLPMRFYDRARTGTLISRLTNDMAALNALVLGGLSLLISSVLTLAGTFVVLFLIDFELALVVVLILPVFGVLGTLLQRRARDPLRDAREAATEQIAGMEETIAGIRTVRTFAQEERHRRRFAELNDRQCEQLGRGQRTIATFQSVALGAGMLLLAVVVAVAGAQSVSGEVAVGTVVSFMAYLRLAFAPLPDLASATGQATQARTSLEHIFGLLAEPAEESDRPGTHRLGRLAGELRFEGVDFAYREGEPVLRGVDLEVPAGETVAVVGETGAGKTTLVRLALRFYDPQDGAVRVDSNDVREVEVASLRAQVGYVPQESFLFSGTVRDNIAFARPSATDEEIRAAAAAVSGLEVLDRLPHGLDTVVGERGATLSAGENQLIALARAVLADPRLVILDEATGCFDAETESRIQAGLERFLGSRSALVVAHRLTTVRDADRIFVLEGGRVAESGTHDELLAAGGLYHELYSAWTQAGAIAER
jgi:ATP-binding cassette, subfamily B, bacterial